jgi:hypothetical protein
MLCKQARQQIDSLPHFAQAAPELTQHITHCSRCAKLLGESTALRSAFDDLRRATATLGPSNHVEQHVLDALNASNSKPRSAPPMLSWITVSALTFAVILVAAVLLSITRTNKTGPNAELPHEEPFTWMPYVDSAAPDQHTTTIRTQVSSQIMQEAGLQVRGDPGSTALADVILGEGGQLLALRLVSPSHPTSSNLTSSKRID